jgi:translation initiation factor IF-3
MAVPIPPQTADQNARNREPRVNHRIRVPEVRLVGQEGEQLGIVAIEDAMRMAQDAGVDLVEVAAAARPPVCKLMDYGKYKYLQKKKANEAKRSSSQVEVKEVKFRPKTDDHDFETKINQARRFLLDGDRVKMTVMFRGREMAYAKREQERLMEIATILADIAQVDVLPKVEGRNMSMMLNPKRGGPAAPVGAPAVKPAEVAPVPVAPAPPAPTGPSVTTRGSTTRPS